MKNRCKRLICMGLVALLTVTSLPEVSAWAAEAVTPEEVVAEQPEMEDVVPGTGGLTNDGFKYIELEDDTIAILSYTGDATDLVIPEEIAGKKVTSIYVNAFSGNTQTSITLPQTITNIGFGAFYGCSNLTSINLPEGITSIGSNAFYKCSSLTSITLPTTVTTIESQAFLGCSSLTSVELPENVTSVENSAFRSCSSLTSVKLSAGITKIADSAFCDCSALTSINLPEGLTDIEETAFYRCKELKDIELPETLTSIGVRAFEGCSSLTSIKLSKNVTNIEEYAFFNCSGLKKVELSEGLKSIPAGAFNACSALTDIELPESLTSIGDYAFAGCKGLTRMDLPAGLTSIGEGALYDCSGLTSIKLPDGLTSIGERLFGGCTGLTSVELPENLTRIGWNMFLECSSLTSIKLPENVTSIGYAAFYGCSALTDINLPKGVSSIEEYAFEGCKKLTGIELPEGLTSIGEAAFRDCSALTDMKLSKNVSSIGADAFDGCDQLTILCDDGSYAYAYVMENKLSVKKICTITFSAEGGTGSSKDSLRLLEGETLGTLPEVTRTGYIFKGWFTEKTGGTAVTKDTKAVSNMTVYAQWEKVIQPIDQAEITLSALRTAYDGKAKKPSVKSVTLAGKVLTAGTDYTIIYSGNTNIGTASVIVTGTGNYTGTVTKTFTIYAKKGTTVTSGAYRYRFTGSSEVAFAGIKSAKTKKVTIPKTVKLGGKTFKVTSIAKKALFNRSKVTSVTIGENVKTIGASAFGKCKKLSTITIRTTKLKSVGKNALNGVRADAKIRVPSKKLKAYRKILKNRGQGRKVTIVKQ